VGYFDSGISSDHPGNKGSYRHCSYIGPDSEVSAAVNYLAPNYTANSYNPFTHNCQHFVDDVVNTVNSPNLK
jgi:hypothetical protein